MKVRVVGMLGLCDAAIIGNDDFTSVRIISPADEEVFVDDLPTFRQRVTVVWARPEEWRTLIDKGFVERKS